MTVLTEETKAKRMREAFGALAGAYIAEGRPTYSAGVQKAILALDPNNESLARLYDLLAATR